MHVHRKCCSGGGRANAFSAYRRPYVESGRIILATVCRERTRLRPCRGGTDVAGGYMHFYQLRSVPYYWIREKVDLQVSTGRTLITGARTYHHRSQSSTGTRLGVQDILLAHVYSTNHRRVVAEQSSSCPRECLVELNAGRLECLCSTGVSCCSVINNCYEDFY
ncbi:hypothetical protein EJ08DRAFT_264371 [Tothia fuscella]|uniref:Uncharacterized protein n=1 Tax=Tothia fuscella TaxID=1048955 RepID=A0A9P4NQP4_9PEZI|nr:hypothetical protein EJ08DRAFT_264371 [Tothia fuscella]